MTGSLSAAARFALQGGEDMPHYSARFYDMKTDSHFPRFFGAGVQCETTRRFPRSVVKVVRKTNFENTVILGGVHGCTPTDLELSYFYTQYMIHSEHEKAYLQNTM